MIMSVVIINVLSIVVLIVRVVTGTQNSRSGGSKRVEVENKEKLVGITTVIDRSKKKYEV